MSETTRHDGQNGQNLPPTSDMIEPVRELIAMMSRGGISELDLTTGDVSIRLRGQSAYAAAPAASAELQRTTPSSSNGTSTISNPKPEV